MVPGPRPFGAADLTCIAAGGLRLVRRQAMQHRIQHTFAHGNRIGGEGADGAGQLVPVHLRKPPPCPEWLDRLPCRLHRKPKPARNPRLVRIPFNAVRTRKPGLLANHNPQMEREAHYHGVCQQLP
jgi:hypothetical protein